MSDKVKRTLAARAREIKNSIQHDHHEGREWYKPRLIEVTY